MIKKSFIGLLIPFSLLSVMGSGSYKIQTDSVNFGGGNSTSSSYTLESTAGEVATGLSSSDNYRMSAGYQQMLNSYISITAESDVSLTSISGLMSGVSTGSTVWTVITDSPAGYSLSVKASTTPAFKTTTGASFSDYAPGGTPSYQFSILNTESAFGYSPEGTHLVAKYLDNGSTCNTGSFDTSDRCWNGFSTTNEVVAQSAVGNHPLGTQTTIKYRAEIGNNKFQDNGNYAADITVTAVAL